jgi:hypothetical protein
LWCRLSVLTFLLVFQRVRLVNLWKGLPSDMVAEPFKHGLKDNEDGQRILENALRKVSDLEIDHSRNDLKRAAAKYLRKLEQNPPGFHRLSLEKLAEGLDDRQIACEFLSLPVKQLFMHLDSMADANIMTAGAVRGALQRIVSDATFVYGAVPIRGGSAGQSLEYGLGALTVRIKIKGQIFEFSFVVTPEKEPVVYLCWEGWKEIQHLYKGTCSCGTPVPESEGTVEGSQSQRKRKPDKQWTPEVDEVLRQDSSTMLSSASQRPKPKATSQKYNRWTPEEDATLRKLKKQGKSWTEISERLSRRTADQIRDHWKYLGLTGGPTTVRAPAGPAG